MTKTNIVEKIMTATAAMSNALVPLPNRTLFVKESVYIQCKLATEIVNIEKMANESIANGVVGSIDGMKVVRVPDSYFPAGVNFLIKYKNSTVDPMKLKTLRVHKNPMGIDGDVGECRFLHDAFVLGTKANGLYVSAAAANIAETPSISISANKATVTSGTASAVIHYTLDGTDPKTSPTAQTYGSSAVDMSAGQTIKAYASQERAAQFRRSGSGQLIKKRGAGQSPSLAFSLHWAIFCFCFWMICFPFFLPYCSMSIAS